MRTLGTGSTVSIAGEVRHPGNYGFSKQVSLAEAIDRAGGFTEQAFLLRMEIFHRDSTSETRNFRTDGDAIILINGDRVFVKRRAPF